MWCVEGISRETKKLFLTLSTHRDMVNLDETITKNVEIDTLITTDCWNGYLNVENIGYLHEKINHSKNFVDPKGKSIHTQNIECFWSYLKKYVKSRGKNLKKNLKQYLVELKFLKNPFEKLLSRISFLSSKNN
ncbi:hypothetical protein CDIK_0343 [Cucumispora dikerogammari]|nr:hypothetical protein CDIK_0343 [Cucumispora dikerogammari]